MSELSAVLVAYFVGSLSLSIVVVRARLGRDIRELGSGNPGATNVLGLLGYGPALLVLAGDVGKGALTIVGARFAGVTEMMLGFVASAVVAGHIYPILYQLRGGKGVATAYGAFGLLSPWAVLLAFAVFVTVVWVSRFVALGSVLSMLSLPVIMLALAALGWGEPSPTIVVACAAGVAVLTLIRHRSNFARMARGTEIRLGDSRRKRGPQ